MPQPRLLHCPFCGERAAELSTRDIDGDEDYHTVAVVRCSNCGAEGPSAGDRGFAGQAYAAAEWNKREAPSEPQRGSAWERGEAPFRS